MKIDQPSSQRTAHNAMTAKRTTTWRPLADEKQQRSDEKQHRRGVAQPANIPAARQREKSDQKLEEEIGRDEPELVNERRVPE